MRSRSLRRHPPNTLSSLPVTRVEELALSSITYGVGLLSVEDGDRAFSTTLANSCHLVGGMPSLLRRSKMRMLDSAAVRHNGTCALRDNTRFERLGAQVRIPE